MRLLVKIDPSKSQNYLKLQKLHTIPETSEVNTTVQIRLKHTEQSWIECFEMMESGHIQFNCPLPRILLKHKERSSLIFNYYKERRSLLLKNSQIFLISAKYGEF
jgi:hypothetical protein